MLGNVREWTADHYAGYISGAVVNPRGPDTGDYRVVRGGSWHSDPGDVTASSRLDMEPEYRSELIGFRCAAD
jgi:formylglycine-generating enzyme